MSTTQRFSLALVGIVAIAGAVIAGFLALKIPRPEDQFSVTAQGRVFASPDISEITLGVETVKKATPEQATKENVEKMNRVTAALTAAGIKKEDIQTTSYNLSPNYNYTPERGQQIDGWNLQQSVHVKIRDLTKIGEVIAAATGAGANQAGGIAFTIDDPETYKAAARAEAIAKAKAKARVIAEEAGIRLGKVLTVYESDFGVTPPMPMYERAMGAGFGGADAKIIADIQPGTNEIVVGVTVVYKVK